MDGEDLSGGEVSPLDQQRIEGDLREEQQRLSFKGPVMWGLCGLIVLSIITLGVFLWRLYCFYPTQIGTNALIFLGLFVAFIAVLVVNLIRLVSKPAVDRKDFESNPWVGFLKELAQTIADAFKNR